jgi:hypothetical protein
MSPEVETADPVVRPKSAEDLINCVVETLREAIKGTFLFFEK